MAENRGFDTGFVYRMRVAQDMVPDLDGMPFLRHLGGGHVEVQTAELLSAYLSREVMWLTMVSEAIDHLDEQADAVRDDLPSGAQILPANLDEADKTGFIDGLRAGARHLSLELGRIMKGSTGETEDERQAANGNGVDGEEED